MRPYRSDPALHVSCGDLWCVAISRQVCEHGSHWVLVIPLKWYRLWIPCDGARNSWRVAN